jgi:hypothetical protein
MSQRIEFGGPARRLAVGNALVRAKTAIDQRTFVAVNGLNDLVEDPV